MRSIFWILLCLTLAACARPVTTEPQTVRVIQQYQECLCSEIPPRASLEHGPEGLRDGYNIEAAVAALGWWRDYIQALEACVQCYEAQAGNGTSGAGDK